jgi:hypothetical protein
MPPKKPPRRAASSRSIKAVRRRKSARIAGTPVEDLIAVRWSPVARERVRRSLARFGTLRPLASGRVFLLSVDPTADRADLAAALSGLQTQGRIAFATPVLRDPESGLLQVLTDEITVRFCPSGGRPAQLKSFGRTYGVTISRRNPFVPNQFVVKVKDPSGLRTLEIARSLDRDGQVEFAAPNVISEIRRQP